MTKIQNPCELENSADNYSHRRGRAAKMPGRREFLQSAMMLGVGMAGLAGRASAAGGPAKAKKVLVGAHGWVYAAPMPGHDYTPKLEEIFADLKYAGIEAFELMDVVLRHDDAVDRLGTLSHQYSVPILGTSYSAEMWDRSKQSAILEDAEMIMTRLAKLGGRTFGTSVGQTRTPKTDEQLDAQAEVLRKVIDMGKAKGIVLNLHNHTYEVANGLHDLKGTLARIPDVKLGPDLNWLVRGGVDPVNFIQTYGKQIVFMHIRDQKADGTWTEAVGEGSMDYPAIGKALHAIPFRGDAVIELAYEKGFVPARPLREDWKISRAFVRKTLGY